MAESFGFIHEKIEIKMLILFVMRRLSEPVAMDVLTELTMCDDGIGYFDVTDCISKLVKSKHLNMEGDNYSLTAKGARNGEILEENLPYSVRIKAEEATALVRAARNRNSMIKTQCFTDDKGGHRVALSLSDGISEIISMELYVAGQQQANSLIKGFRKNAEKIYHAIIEMIMN
jgi:hypothetical protein